MKYEDVSKTLIAEFPSFIPPEDFGDETKKWWIELNKFWNGEIKYVGETYANK